MQTGTVLTSTALILASGFLVLASVLSAARPALAQAQRACPLPAGVTPPADPRVTAQQVEDGSGSLRDFARAARDLFRQETVTIEESLFIGCRVRQEGSPWRSGSTYLVQLTPDGRVYIHAKNMALSARLLHPVIYGETLAALGVSLTDLANLASPDPGTAALALQAVLATLSQEPDAPFDATVTIPGASGYAVAYLSANFGLPIVMLAGFDLDESHLIPISDEAIDYGAPAVPARDVVDRDTLKAFVTQAGEFVLQQAKSGDIATISKARIALRDPNGPWRHGPVYLYTLDLTSNIILFHGTFPDRYELRPLVATIRDVVTGELILPQVIEAAKSNPEGGFVEYYFDDPTDDTDSADIPKVGYSRQFTGEVSFGERVVPLNFIVGSGFYQSAGAVGLRGVLENPGPDSFQSGVSALWGWVCDAEMVEIEIETAQGEVEPYLAAYGMERLDTLDICGDTNNGFVLLFNWNLLGAGEHTVTALVDGIELGRALVRVTTLGEGEEFLRGVAGECVAEDFPHQGQRTRLEWQQNSQNFVITDVQ